ncbi:IS200/IS605 family transposase, partial [Fischerella thermalis]|uniref:IS200/IS605 family transposase n=1 Tax=Fischerella thermalis TaxID=372787 RepID=UPI001CA56B8B
MLVTKYRRKVITSEMLIRLKAIFKHLCEQQKSILIEFNGEEDHVHLLVNLSPDNNVSEFFNEGSYAAMLKAAMLEAAMLLCWRQFCFLPSALTSV